MWSIVRNHIAFMTFVVFSTVSTFNCKQLFTFIRTTKKSCTSKLPGSQDPLYLLSFMKSFIKEHIYLGLISFRKAAKSSWMSQLQLMDIDCKICNFISSGSFEIEIRTGLYWEVSILSISKEYIRTIESSW